MTARSSLHNALHSLPPGAQQALRAAQDPFLDEHWLRIFSRFVVPSIGSEAWLCVEDSHGRHALLPAMLPAQEGPRILHAMTNYYSPSFHIVRERGCALDSTDIISAFAPILRDFDRVRLAPLRAAHASELRVAFDALGWFTHQFDYSVNWKETDIEDFERYWKRRPSNLRNSVKRKMKKAERAGASFSFYTDEVPAEALYDYHRVYRESWKPLEPYPAFIDALAQDLAARGELRLGLLHLDGEPAAAQLWLQRGATAYVYKLSYRPRFTDFSPGTLLSYRMFQWLIDDWGASTIDYLTGDDGYKQDWVGSRHPLVGLECCNPRRFRGWTGMLRNRLSELRRQG